MVGPIRTARLILRPWSETDRQGFAALALDPRVTQHVDDGSVWALDRINEVFDRQIRHWERYGFGWRSATSEEDGSWLGFIGINHVGSDAPEVVEDEVEIGWWLAPSSWGKGIATEGAFAVRDEAFERVGLDRLIGRYRPDNIASGRIMERIGMVFEKETTGWEGTTLRIHAIERDRWSALRPER